MAGILEKLGLTPEDDEHEANVGVLKRLGLSPEPDDHPATAPKKRAEVRALQETAAPRLRGYTEQVLQGMPIISPMMDRATALTGAAIQPLMDKEAPATFGERYDRNLENIRNQNKSFSEKNPIGSTLANITGAGLSTVPLMATRVGSALFGNVGPNAAARAITGAATGSALGGSDAALRGENPVNAALIGGGAGALGPLVGEGVRAATSGIANAMAPRVGPLAGQPTANVNLLANALSGETPASLAEARKRMGPSGFLADVNTGMTDLAGGLADTPGAHKAVVREAYIDRQQGQRTRMDRAFTEGAGPRFNIENMKNMITEERKAAADPLYEKFRTMEVKPTAEIKALMPRLEKSGAFDRAVELADVTGDKITKNFFTGGPDKAFPTTQTWDYVKQGLDRQIDAAYNKGDKTMARALVKLKNETIDEIEKTPAGKVWKDARKEFATHSSLLDQLEAGRDTFLGGRSGLSKDELKEELKSLSRPELMARIHGMRASMDEAMGAALNGDGTLRAKLLAPNNQEKLRLMVGDKRADKIIDSLKSEEFLSKQTSNVVGNMQTGASAEMRKGRRENLIMQPTTPWDINLQQPRSWLPPRLVNALSPATVIDAYRGQRHGEHMNKLANVLLTPEGPSMDDLLHAIRNEAARREVAGVRAGQAGNVLSGAIVGPGSQVVQRRYQ